MVTVGVCSKLKTSCLVFVYRSFEVIEEGGSTSPAPPDAVVNLAKKKKSKQSGLNMVNSLSIFLGEMDVLSFTFCLLRMHISSIVKRVKIILTNPSNELITYQHLKKGREDKQRERKELRMANKCNLIYCLLLIRVSRKKLTYKTICQRQPQ